MKEIYSDRVDHKFYHLSDDGQTILIYKLDNISETSFMLKERGPFNHLARFLGLWQTAAIKYLYELPPGPIIKNKADKKLFK